MYQCKMMQLVAATPRQRGMETAFAEQNCMRKGTHAFLLCIRRTLMGVDGEGAHGRGSATEGGVDRARYRRGWGGVGVIFRFLRILFDL
jgi:hypothetical protein